MKSKKVTMLVAVLAVAVVALAGVGYAATNYVGTTQNSGNNMDVTYVKVSQGGDAKYESPNQFIKSTYFDTETTSTGTKYTVTGKDSDVATITGVTGAYYITDATMLQLIISDTVASGETAKQYTLKITADKDFLYGTSDSKISYYFGLKVGDTVTWSNAGVTSSATGAATEWTFTNSVAKGTYSVVMAAAGSVTIPTEATTGAPDDVTGVTFTFEASYAIA